MRTTCTRRPAAIISALLILVQIPAGVAHANPKTGDAIEHRRGLEVTFTKWVTDMPNMAGVVSGDAGGGIYAGEILAYDHTDAVDTIDARYHIRGSGRQFTARVTVVQNNKRGTASIRGVVVNGPLRGKRVRGDYQVIAPCGIINAQLGAVGDVCFQGTLAIGPDEH